MAHAALAPGGLRITWLACRDPLTRPFLAVEAKAHVGLQHRTPYLIVVDQRNPQQAEPTALPCQDGGGDATGKKNPQQISEEKRRPYKQRHQSDYCGPDQGSPHGETLIHQAPPGESAHGSW